MATKTIDTSGWNSPRVFRDTALSNVAVGVSSSGTTHIELTGWNVINPNATPVYVKFFDSSSGTVVVGTTPIVRTLLIPGSSTVLLEHNKDNPQNTFIAGMAMACVTGIADTDTTAPTTAIYVEAYLNRR